MGVNKKSFLEFLISLILAIYLIFISGTEKLMMYINPKLSIFVLIAGLIFLLMSFSSAIGLFEHSHGKRKYYRYIIYIIPISLLFTQPVVMGASRVNISKNVPVSISDESMEDYLYISEGNTSDQSLAENITEEKTVHDVKDISEFKENLNPEKIDKSNLDSIEINDENYFDWLITFFADYENLNMDDYVGKEIELHGMVYKDEMFEENQFLIGKYVIVCCSVDGQYTGFLCEYDRAEEVKQNSWVKVEGIIDVIQWDGEQIYIKIKNVKEIPVPNYPYVYPS
ncbi:MAG: TIGR03943 family protein [Firmicutes bacterium]|jgi:putative membrane protein|nr:TIGR03943 family protein [Bacillota bacterium]